MEWCDGSEVGYEALCRRLVETGTFTRPGATSERSEFAFNLANVRNTSFDA